MDLASQVTEDSPLLSGIVSMERRINAGTGGAMLNIRWRWCILCAALGVVGLVSHPTGQSPPANQADAPRQPPRPQLGMLPARPRTPSTTGSHSTSGPPARLGYTTCPACPCAGRSLHRRARRADGGALLRRRTALVSGWFHPRVGYYLSMNDCSVATREHKKPKTPPMTESEQEARPKQLVIESPWLQIASDFQCFCQPPQLSAAPRVGTEISPTSPYFNHHDKN
jgi:hypothetical protein